MTTNGIIELIVNEYLLVIFLALFVISLVLLISKHKTFSKVKKSILSIILVISIIIISINAIAIFGFSKDNRPEYVKRDLQLLESTEVNISKVEFVEDGLLVEGQIPNKQEFAEIKVEIKDDKLYLIVLAKHSIVSEDTFKYKVKGDFDKIKSVYLRSIEGGIGGLEDELVYKR